jgi:chemotaxis protein methyltransferase CheR
VAAQIGLRVELARAGELVDQRAARRREPIAAYLDRIDDADPEELRALIGELTVGETYFLRHVEQFRAFVDIAVPDRLAHGRLRVLSAGCSSGEEPYTLAMLLRESFPGSPFALQAIDVNEQAIARARAGRYSRWSLRTTTPAFENRWLRSEGRDVVVSPEIRAAVKFDRANLFDDRDPALAGPWDVVFCRNVIMYFTDEQADAAIERFARSVAPGGYLFLGHAETLRDRTDDFALCHTHGTFYYQRLPVPRSRRATGQAEPGSSASAPTAHPADWYRDIRAAADRVRALTDVALDLRPAPMVTEAPAPDPLDLTRIRELVAEERFGDALAQLDRLAATAGPPGAHASRRDIATLRALVLTHSGRFADARAACSELLALDATSAGANYLLALCCDSTGDPRGAAEQAQIAAKLDPSFAMPRLHLGLHARRAGDRELASRELTRAIELLERETPARLSMYGGGFSRQALLGMCRAELTAIGASR